MDKRIGHFEKRIVPKANLLLNSKGFVIVKYFDGIIGATRSEEIKVLFEDSAKNKTPLNKEDFKYVALMGRS